MFRLVKRVSPEFRLRLQQSTYYSYFNTSLQLFQVDFENQWITGMGRGLKEKTIKFKWLVLIFVFHLIYNWTPWQVGIRL